MPVPARGTPREGVSELFGELQLRTGSAYYAQIWHVLNGQAFYITHLWSTSARAHARTLLLHISGTAKRIALKFGVSRSPIT